MKRNSIFTLLLKSYILFTAAVLIVIIIIGFVTNILNSRMLREPQAKIITKQESLLESEAYSKLKLKAALGIDGYYQIVDDNMQVIYSSDSSQNHHYTPEGMEFIEDFSGNEYYSRDPYYDENGNRMIIIQKYRFEYSEDENMGFLKVLDVMIVSSNQEIIYSSFPMQKKSLSKEEYEYISGEDSKYNITKYTFYTNTNAKRYLVMYSIPISPAVYQILDLSLKISIIVLIICYILLTILFVKHLNNKVKRPLLILDNAIDAFAEGDRDTIIDYEGPEEFKHLFGSYNNMAVQLRESETKQKELSLEKQRLLADISHDLKTPITVIQGYAKALQDGLISPQEEKKYLTIIYNKAENVTKLINAFYEYSRLEHPDFTLNREEGDFCEFLRVYAAQKYEEVLLEGYELKVDLLDEIITYSFDSLLFTRVLDNLFNNSVKYNKAGTMLYLALKKDKNDIVLYVGDNGIGISQDKRDHIFEPFVVGDESRNAITGTGLGLAVVSSVVKMHKGTVEILETEEWSVLTRICLPLDYEHGLHKPVE